MTNTRNSPILTLGIAACLVSATAPFAVADVTLPAIFGDHMVLQRDQKVPVWGFASDGEKVTVSFAGQKAQTAALSIPNTGMAVTTDVATVGNIHPPDKQTVGHRLALLALAKTYQKPIGSYASPLFDSLKVEGSKAQVSFKNAEGGLKSANGQALTWFTIAGEDKKFVEAKAEISGIAVIVSAEGVGKPVAVRFGWHETAEPNLANDAGLPVSPFRTDKWTDATMPVIAPPTSPAPAKK